MEFKSQICTTKEQSERLLALGLKKETADMYHDLSTGITEVPYTEVELQRELEKNDILPAWSLHRLIEIADVPCFGFLRYSSFNDVVIWLGSLIEKGAINPQFLEDKQ